MELWPSARGVLEIEFFSFHFLETSKEEASFLFLKTTEMEQPDQTFKGYEKMYEDTRDWEMSDADFRALKKTQCVVLEKIHGAKYICLECCY